MKVRVAEAKNRLTQLILSVENGERVTICRHGKPIVDIVRTDEAPRGERRFGVLAGEMIIIDPNWARPQNDLDAWLKGDV